MARVLQVSEATVSRLVSGDRQPSLELMIKIRSTLRWKLDAQADALQSGSYGEVLAGKMSKAKAPKPPEAEFEVTSDDLAQASFEEAMEDTPA